MRLTLLGLGVGLLASSYLTQIMARLLFGVTAFDLPLYFCVALFLGVVALVACWLPARRAAKVDPALALRAE